MKLKYLFCILAVFSGLLVAGAQEMIYEQYVADDGRISFDAPEGWIITPFGPAFNISTQGWVDAALVEPGQQQIDIITLDAETLASAGITQDLPLQDFATAVLDMLDDGSSEEAITIDGSRTTTLNSGIEAAVMDISHGSAQIFITVYRQGDVAVFVSSFAHESEFETFEPIALHVINSIQILDSSFSVANMPSAPTVIVTATDDEIQIPPVPEEGISAGIYTFQYTNDRSEGEFSPLIARLNEGVTLEDFNTALTAENPLEAVFLVNLYGGSTAMPGDSFSVTTELIPGDYILMELGPEGPGEDMITFSVMEDEMAEETVHPQADITMTMADFVFSIPQTIESGELIWNIENAGEQWHEAVILKVPEGTTREDILTLFESGEEGGEPEQAFFWAPMGAGIEAWTTIDLEPGTYAIVCFLPDLAGEFAPHIAHGMVQVFTVVE